MKYFISKKFFSIFYNEITDKNYINQIEKHENLKVGDSIIILDNAIDFKLTLKQKIDNEMYFEY
jgi:hypothetical protein